MSLLKSSAGQGDRPRTGDSTATSHFGLHATAEHHMMPPGGLTIYSTLIADLLICGRRASCGPFSGSWTLAR